jgi:hypothetical protein
MNINTTTLGDVSPLRLLFLLLLVPALAVFTGCDSGGNGGSSDGNGNGNGSGSTTQAAVYDTTETASDGSAERIVVADINSGGVVPAGDSDNKVTWTSDVTYELNGFVFVNADETLEIEAGTTIQGQEGQGSNASALIVTSGATIQANGTASNPVVFTSELADDQTLGRDDRGLWGGVILLGDAPTNNGSEVAIEGVPDNTGSRILYGGQNDDHNIGTFKYVSIRHTGTQLGNGDEIQGLTLGGVGHGSEIHHVESYASADDGFEWFGGTVNTKYLITAFESDDAFDIDQGYQGSNQFWLAVQGGTSAGRASEMDGGSSPESAQPYATSIISNATYIGMGAGTSNVSGDANDPFLIHRDNNATSYYNSVFTGGRTDKGLQIEDLSGSSEDAANRWDGDGDGSHASSDPLAHVDNIWHDIGADFSSSGNPSFADLIQLTTDDQGNVSGDRGTGMRSNLASYLSNNGNQIVSDDPLSDISRSGGGTGAIQSFDPAAANAANVGSSVSSPGDFGSNGGTNSTFTSVSFKGAFGPAGKTSADWNLDTNWAKVASTGVLK